MSAKLPLFDLNVFTSPPPASGSIVAGILNIMDQFNHQKKDLEDPVMFQHFVEACKFGFAKRTLMGDWSDEGARPTIEKVVN